MRSVSPNRDPGFPLVFTAGLIAVLAAFALFVGAVLVLR